MPLENMTDMLAKASAGKYAVGAFNILDYNSTKAVVGAAEETDSPVIIQTSAKTVVFWGTTAIIGWVRELAESSPVPIVLHLDHCKDLELIRRCIEAGWTSAMIDASAKPFEENLVLSEIGENLFKACAGKPTVLIEGCICPVLGRDASHLHTACRACHGDVILKSHRVYSINTLDLADSI